MKIRGLKPTTRPRMLGSGALLRYMADGTAVAAKHPRGPSGPLNPLTEQQAAQWDDALQMTNSAIGTQRIAAKDIAGSTGFYDRDVLVAACYGHMVSWPGWGIFPDGPAGQPLHTSSRGNRTFPPRGLGDPQPINALSSLRVDNGGDPITVDATTFHSATPVIERFCCQPNKIPILVGRAGNIQPHGYKLFFHCDPVQYNPTTGYGKAHHWDLPVADFDPPCPDCVLVFVEKGPQPLLSWCSLPEQCPVGHGPPPVTPGWYYRSVAGDSGPHGYTPAPAFVAAANAQLDAELACYLPAHVAQVQREFKFVDGGFIPSIAGMTDATLPGELCGPSGPEGFYSDTFVDCDVSNISLFGDLYLWGYMLHYS